MSEKLGIRLNFTTGFHPQSNGLVERIHPTSKAALRARLSNDKWTDHLQWVVLDLKVSIAVLVFGSQVSLHCDFSTSTPDDVDVTTFVNILHNITNAIHYSETSNHDTKRNKYIPSDLLKSKLVFIRANNCRK
ncbi:hypothetical protein RF11_07373 [Thelohanellus kitauei]|uniref:Integrase catalytic domain-containing protein n=1 Tax=Thelohanellus kitauei TaxID=669202 RepID=A0A0C2M0U5_THEKT|nr:hypothetical protein RF11_07373 [Thelohanellus kitauei]